MGLLKFLLIISHQYFLDTIITENILYFWIMCGNDKSRDSVSQSASALNPPTAGIDSSCAPRILPAQAPSVHR